MRHRARAAALAGTGALLAATLVAVGTSSAQSATAIISVGTGTASCPAGYVCIWEHAGYQGRGIGFYGDNANYYTLAYPFNWLPGASSSFYNHGNSYDVRFFWYTNYSGRSFVLCRGDALSQVPRDDELPAGSDRTWNDEVASHDWQAGLC